MLNHKLSIAATLAAALLVPTVSTAADAVMSNGWRAVGGEAAWVYEGTASSGLTRGEVRRALASPGSPTADGWRFVGGEAAWVVDGPRLVVVNKQLVHADDCLFNPAKASPVMKDSGPRPFDNPGA